MNFLSKTYEALLSVLASTSLDGDEELDGSATPRDEEDEGQAYDGLQFNALELSPGVSGLVDLGGGLGPLLKPRGRGGEGESPPPHPRSS